jgi:hypothetical protein
MFSCQVMCADYRFSSRASSKAGDAFNIKRSPGPSLFFSFMCNVEMQNVRRGVSYTKVNLWIIVNRHIDFLLCLCRPSVITWWMIVGNGFHSLVD